MLTLIKGAWKVAGAFLGGLPGGPTLWLAGALAAGAALWIGALKIELADARTKAATTQSAFDKYKAAVAIQAAKDNAVAIEALKAWQAWNEAAVAVRLAAAKAENEKLQAKLAEIRNAPPETDAPPSAGSCAYFSGVWGKQACAADRRN